MLTPQIIENALKLINRVLIPLSEMEAANEVRKALITTHAELTKPKDESLPKKSDKDGVEVKEGDKTKVKQTVETSK